MLITIGLFIGRASKWTAKVAIVELQSYVLQFRSMIVTVITNTYVSTRYSKQ